MSKLILIGSFTIVVLGIILISNFAYPKYEFIFDGNEFYKCNRITGEIQYRGVKFNEYWKKL